MRCALLPASAAAATAAATAWTSSDRARCRGETNAGGARSDTSTALSRSLDVPHSTPALASRPLEALPKAHLVSNTVTRDGWRAGWGIRTPRRSLLIHHSPTTQHVHFPHAVIRRTTLETFADSDAFAAYRPKAVVEASLQEAKARAAGHYRKADKYERRGARSHAHSTPHLKLSRSASAASTGFARVVS